MRRPVVLILAILGILVVLIYILFGGLSDLFPPTPTPANINTGGNVTVTQENRVETPTPLPPSPVNVLPTSSPTLMPTRIPATTPSPAPQPNPASLQWRTDGLVLSIDVMKLTQDEVCQPLNKDIVREAIRLIKEAGATHVALSAPLDQVRCGNGKTGDSLALIKEWTREAHAANLGVWFRLKHSSAEGFYDTPRNLDPAFHIKAHVDFITAHPELFERGDIYTPNPEPENAGIQGVNCFPGQPNPNHPGQTQMCLFKGIGNDPAAGATDAFNRWLVQAYDETHQAFSRIGKTDIRVGYWGTSGFTTWGDRNKDWNGIITDETISRTNRIVAFDHYWDRPDGEVDYQKLLAFYKEDKELQKAIDSEKQTGKASPYVEYAKIRMRFGWDVTLCVSEWGAIHNETPEYLWQVLQASWDYGIRCFNYWHFAASPQEKQPGPEVLAVWNGRSFTPTPLYAVVKDFYRGQRS